VREIYSILDCAPGKRKRRGISKKGKGEREWRNADQAGSQQRKRWKPTRAIA